MSARGRDYDVPADLAEAPDDGQRYEITDGSLVVTPMAGGERSYGTGPSSRPLSTPPTSCSSSITSPRQQGRDLVPKRAVYERAGIPTYVIAGPAGLILLELREGRYVEVVTGATVDLATPYPVTLGPLS